MLASRSCHLQWLQSYSNLLTVKVEKVVLKSKLNKSCCVVSCHVMSCHVMSCHVMSCHVMSCHVMSCHVMSCHVAIMSCRYHETLWRVMCCRVVS